MKKVLAGAALIVTGLLGAVLHLKAITPPPKFKAGDCIVYVMRIGPTIDESGNVYGQPMCTVTDIQYEIQGAFGRGYKINGKMVSGEYIESNYMQTECKEK